jgi:tRNA(Ile)-lysidine synthase TilS/MesJ
MYLIREKDIIHWRDYNDLHFIQCACRLTESCASCGGTEQGSKRGAVKDLIRTLTAQNPQIEKNIFRSVENVNLDTVIAYKQGRTRHHFLDRPHNHDQMKMPEGIHDCCHVIIVD